MRFLLRSDTPRAIRPKHATLASCRRDGYQNFTADLLRILARAVQPQMELYGAISTLGRNVFSRSLPKVVRRARPRCSLRRFVRLASWSTDASVTLAESSERSSRVVSFER